jgi:hypothetical protein
MDKPSTLKRLTSFKNDKLVEIDDPSAEEVNQALTSLHPQFNRYVVIMLEHGLIHVIYDIYGERILFQYYEFDLASPFRRVHRLLERIVQHEDEVGDDDDYLFIYRNGEGTKEDLGATVDKEYAIEVATYIIANGKVPTQAVWRRHL